MTEHTPRAHNFKDLTRQRFGKLVAIELVKRPPSTSAFWLCHCDCGNTAIVGSYVLRSSKQVSCGCHKTQLAANRTRTHGKSSTRTYTTWRNIIARCESVGSASYHNYGARSIRICGEWRHDFQSFYDHVSRLKNFGKKGYSLDRIDNDKDYMPGNVQWATRKQQSLNKRSNQRLSYNGKIQTFSEWERELDFPQGIISNRINRYGWSVEKALTTPPGQHRYRKPA